VVAMDATSSSISEKKCLASEKLLGELSSILDKTRLLRLRKYSILIRRPRERKQSLGQFRIEVSPTMPFLGTIIITPSSPKSLSSRIKTGEGPETAQFSPSASERPAPCLALSQELILWAIIQE
jgi:hypothetical protein